MQALVQRADSPFTNDESEDFQADAISPLEFIKAQIEAGKTEQLLIDCFKAAGLGRGDDGHVTHSH